MFGGQTETAHRLLENVVVPSGIRCCQNAIVAGGTVVFVFSIPIQQDEDLQQIWSPWTKSLTPDHGMEDKSPAFRGNRLNAYKREAEINTQGDQKNKEINPETEQLTAPDRA